jgi:hypothetical protein
LLAITDDRWLVIVDEESQPYVAHATFDDILLLELTVVRCSALRAAKAGFCERGSVSDTAVQFDSVSKSDYFEAIESLLARMEVRPISQDGKTSEPTQGVKDWPLKFRNIVSEYLQRTRYNNVLISCLYFFPQLRFASVISRRRRNVDSLYAQDPRVFVKGG